MHFLLLSLLLPPSFFFFFFSFFNSFAIYLERRVFRSISSLEIRVLCLGFYKKSLYEGCIMLCQEVYNFVSWKASSFFCQLVLWYFRNNSGKFFKILYRWIRYHWRSGYINKISKNLSTVYRRSICHLK